MRVLDLFSGIGGFSLGLERAGMTTVAFCEVNDFCRAVLKKHWPTVPIYDDVQTLTASRLAADGIGVDVICGGFPCQDISIAGKGAGLAGKRSGLWYEFHRLINEIKPRYAVIENVSALRSKGLEDVLGSLAEIGYDAEWHCIPASAVGAPHRRDRIWIVAYANGSVEADGGQRAYPASESASGRNNGAGSDSDAREIALRGAGRGSEVMADSNGQQQQSMFSQCGVEGSGAITSTGTLGVDVTSGSGSGTWSSDVAYAGRQPAQVSFNGRFTSVTVPEWHSWWEIEPQVGRVADGVPKRLDRLKSLGNAVVPQIPQIIGQWIMQYESTYHYK